MIDPVRHAFLRRARADAEAINAASDTIHLAARSFHPLHIARRSRHSLRLFDSTPSATKSTARSVRRRD